MDKSNTSTLQRPRNPPPPAPLNPSSSRLSNGRSSESLSSMCSEHGIGNPVPPPRKVRIINYLFYFYHWSSLGRGLGLEGHTMVVDIYLFFFFYHNHKKTYLTIKHSLMSILFHVAFCVRRFFFHMLEHYN